MKMFKDLQSSAFVILPPSLSSTRGKLFRIENFALKSFNRCSYRMLRAKRAETQHYPALTSAGNNSSHAQASRRLLGGWEPDKCRRVISAPKRMQSTCQELQSEMVTLQSSTCLLRSLFQELLVKHIGQEVELLLPVSLRVPTTSRGGRLGHWRNRESPSQSG